MKQDKPLLIVTSCTRNYGWVTRAFLEGNTRWADFIVIVDQMSTDGTREMCAEYSNVVIVDDPDLSYKESTRAKMGFMKGRELAAGRDAIYFALDIDEVMPANWMDTEDGMKILSSKPGDMFQLEWANIKPDGKLYTRRGWQYKVFHDNGMDWQESVEEMHTPLLPYSSWEEDTVVPVHDFPLLHFGGFNLYWSKYKGVYYKFLDIQLKRYKSVIAIHRGNFTKATNVQALPIEQEWLYKDADIIGMVDTVTKPIFFQYINELVEKEGVDKFKSIDVWSDELCTEIGVQDPRTWGWRWLHYYLRKTQPFKSTFLVRGIDKILKFFV